MKRNLVCILGIMTVIGLSACGKSEIAEIETQESIKVEQEEKISANDNKEIIEANLEEKNEDVKEEIIPEKVSAADVNIKDKKEEIVLPINKLDSNVTLEDFQIVVNNTIVVMGTDINELINELGQPDSLSTARSCVDDGEEKQFVYEGYTIYTYPNGNKDIIYLVEFGENAFTDAKIGLDSSREEVEKAYGLNFETMGEYVVYDVDDLASISLIYTDNKVSYLDMYYK